MKRIAALAAVLVALVGLPATAMASTSNAAPRKLANPAQCLVYVQHGKLAHVAKSPQFAVVSVTDKGVKIYTVLVTSVPTGASCAATVAGGPFQLCSPGIVTITIPGRSSTITELTGPKMRSGDVVIYGGVVYQIASAHGTTITLKHDQVVFVNGAKAVTRNTALALCTSRSAPHKTK